MSPLKEEINGSMALWGIVALSIAALIALQAKIDTTISEDAVKKMLFLPDKHVMHAFGLGDDATAADMLWLRGVFYIAANSVEEKQDEFNSDLRTKATRATTGALPKSFEEADFRNDPRLRSMFFWNMGSNDAPHLYRLAEIVSDLDPRFITPYIHSATNLAMFYGRYDEAKRILDKGIANRPDSWEPLYHRGFLRLFYENDKLGAADDVRRAAIMKGAPTIVIQLAAALEVGAGRRNMALDFLRSLREVTDDEVLRQKIDDMIAVYGAKATARAYSGDNQVGSVLDSLLLR